MVTVIVVGVLVVAAFVFAVLFTRKNPTLVNTAVKDVKNAESQVVSTYQSVTGNKSAVVTPVAPAVPAPAPTVVNK